LGDQMTDRKACEFRTIATKAGQESNRANGGERRIVARASARQTSFTAESDSAAEVVDNEETARLDSRIWRWLAMNNTSLRPRPVKKHRCEKCGLEL